MNTRPLQIDFELYTQDDKEFKKELIALMIRDMTEFQSTLKNCFGSGDFSSYRPACHKMNSTLVIINDEELFKIVGEIKSGDQCKEKVEEFSRTCSEIVESLNSEMLLESSLIS